MKSYDEVFQELLAEQDFGPDYEVREVKMWRVHCKHCGVMRVGTIPQTDKALAAAKRLVEGMRCRNPKCVSNGGTEKRRVA